MKKVLLFIALSSIAYGQSLVEGKNRESLVEGRVGYFFFSDSTMRKVYSEGGLDVQLSASGPVWKWLHLYGAVEYAERNGKSLGGHQGTKFRAIPLSFALKPVININSWADYYILLGPRYFFIDIKNHSSFVNPRLNKSGLGGFIGTGFLFHQGDCFTFDVFGEYSYKRMHFHGSEEEVTGHSVPVGGFTFGAGVGYRF